jgi:diaminopimelate decarboxylase
MSGFALREGVLHCENVPLERIAHEAGTPTYVYSSALIRDRYHRLDAASENCVRRSPRA